MKRAKIGNVILRCLGVVLLAAAILKGHELLTTPVANKDIWSYRPFLVFQVECELMLAVWLLSGLWRRAAWLVTISCFGLFCCVTLYKGLTGAASCGCFGNVPVNPWITLFILDLPAVVSLAFFRPKGTIAAIRLFLLRFVQPLRMHFNDGIRSKEVIRRPWTIAVLRTFRRLLYPLHLVRSFVVATFVLILVGTSTLVLATNVPAQATASYEVLEPETWIDQQLPILDQINIADQLKQGNWLILFYHHDCPGCAKAIPEYEQIARDLNGNEGFLRLALVAVPPYGHGPVSDNSPCVLGRLAETKEWFVTTPAVTLLAEGIVRSGWEGKAPDFDAVMGAAATLIQ